MNGSPDAPRRTFHILVLVALAAMLAGTILLLAGREPFRADVAPGSDAVVLEIEPSAWDPMGHPFELRVFLVEPGTANVTVSAGDDSVNKTLLAHDALLRVEGRGESGEAVRVTVQNDGPTAVRVTGEMSSRITYVLGGVLVGIGLLGFVFYRTGMT